ncbi:Hypothetical predicted protein [Paramuricea clavata]|uniref:Uncharacterized protein n=1 Tax=Paramuricea clavata TaxID=317549 RepID=A0A6S7FY23_PARCT|nr:Hypothetical predicted protein [Paramuricea clavata]
MSGGKEPTHFHVMVVEGVQSLTRSKELVTALNCHGISVSYNMVKRIDVDITEQIISMAGDNSIPLPLVLESSRPLNAAMDNFDRNKKCPNKQRKSIRQKPGFINQPLEIVNEIDTFGLLSLVGELLKWKGSGDGLCCPWIYNLEKLYFEFPCYHKNFNSNPSISSYHIRCNTNHHDQLSRCLETEGDSYSGLWADKVVYREIPRKKWKLRDLWLIVSQSINIGGEIWNATQERVKATEENFDLYLKEMPSKSKSFAFWNTYVSNLYPIARDFTNSMCSGDWTLYLSAVERATSLSFFFGRTNYCRWTPMFLQDCYQLKDKFLLLYKSYMDGGFVMNGNKKGSGVPFDQALEQCYNWPAKISGGIIGVTRKEDDCSGFVGHHETQERPVCSSSKDATCRRIVTTLTRVLQQRSLHWFRKDTYLQKVRKVPLKKLEPPVKTFHDLAVALTAMITNTTCNCEEIHIVFDTYKEDSIKNVERKREI